MARVAQPTVRFAGAAGGILHSHCSSLIARQDSEAVHRAGQSAGNSGRMMKAGALRFANVRKREEMP
jgi:hypothetical protein